MTMYHVTPIENLPSIKRYGLIPKIGKRSQKLGEPVEAVYLFLNKDEVNDALANWLGDEFWLENETRSWQSYRLILQRKK